jgi:hypothetical protein
MGRSVSSLALVLGLAAGCSLDWTVGGDAGGAGGTNGSGGADGGDAATSKDSGADRRAPPTEAGSPDARDAGDAAGQCMTLEENVNRALTAALLCRVPGAHCDSLVTDQCGCRVHVASPSSSATMAYVAAVQAFDEAGCKTCGSCSTPTTTVCLQQELDGGLVTICTPDP